MAVVGEGFYNSIDVSLLAGAFGDARGFVDFRSYPRTAIGPSRLTTAIRPC